MVRHLQLTENEPARPFALSVAEAEALDSAELAIVTRSPGSDAWHVAAGAKVGVANIGDLQVTIRPKIPMDRLVFLLGYARQPTFWRDNSVLLDADIDLVDALAESFQRLARKALEQGLLQGYLTVDESLQVLRGRVRIGDQIGRRLGVGIPLEVTYDDFTVDIAENQLLLAAALRLMRLPTLSSSARTALHRVRMQLNEVTPPTRGSAIPAWVPSRLNTRYQPALRLAELILAGDSFEQRVGDLKVSGFVFDMWKIYEDFVCLALKEAMAPFGGRSRLQRTLYLDDDEQVKMKPDYLWSGRDGRQVVVDAKYKAEKPDGFPNADLYQLLAYCTVLGLDSGHLVYAKGNESAQVHSVKASDIRIHCHALDLEAPPSVLLAAVSELGEMIRASA